jgi:hypothetical protein
MVTVHMGCTAKLAMELVVQPCYVELLQTEVYTNSMSYQKTVADFETYMRSSLVIVIFCILTAKKKELNSKAIPLQAWTGPEGSRRLRLPDFKTIGKVVNPTHFF